MVVTEEDKEITQRKPPLHVNRRKWRGTSQGVYYLVDLIDFHTIADKNEGFKYLLVCEDLYSRYVQAVPLKGKKPADIQQALELIFDKMGKPNFIASDEEGGLNRQWLKSKGILLYYPNGKFGASPIERFIRTFKEDLSTYFTRDRKNWIDHFKDIINEYNNRGHSTLKKHTKVNGRRLTEKLTPEKVFNKEEDYVEESNPKNLKSNDRNPKFKVGDYVRFAVNKNLMKFKKKSLQPNYSLDIFKVKKIDTTRKPIGYKLERVTFKETSGDVQNKQRIAEINNANKRLFYSNELKKTNLRE